MKWIPLLCICCICLLPRGIAATEKSPATQPYPYLAGTGFTGPQVPESPDPLVAYQWPAPQASDGLQVYLTKPTAFEADTPDSFSHLD